MDPAASAAAATETQRLASPASGDAPSGRRGRNDSRGRGRGRERGRGQGRGRGPANHTDSELAPPGAAASNPTDAVGEPTSAVEAVVEPNVDSAPTKQTKRSKGKNKTNNKNKKTAAAGAAHEDDANGKRKATPAIPERTPVETLAFSIRTGDQQLFDDVLAQHPELDANAATPRGDVLLVEACRYARVDMVRALVADKRADVNAASTNEKGGRKGFGPLHAAVMALSEDIVDELLQAPGQVADPTALYDMATPAAVAVFYCVANGYPKQQEEKALVILAKLLTYAKHQGENFLRKLLETETSKGNQIVHIAVMIANFEAVKVLKSFGADFSVPNSSGLSCLQLMENNAFQRRSLALSRLPLQNANAVAKKQARKRKSGAPKVDGDAARAIDYPESAAEVQAKANHAVKRLDRDVENEIILQTLLPLVDVFGLGCIFSRKGVDGIRSIHIKSLMLAHEGILSVVTKIASLVDDDKMKPVYLDGVMHCVTSLQGLALKSDHQFGKLWKQAFLGPNGGAVALKEPVLSIIIDTILAHKSSSRRVKVWTMVLVKTLGVFDRDSPILPTEEEILAQLPISILGVEALYIRIAEAIFRAGCKLLFSIFDQTEFDEDESYEDELGFLQLIALVELFFQMFAPFIRLVSNADKTVPRTFTRVIAPIKRLWELLSTALASIDETVSSPQRFSLVLHVLQVFEVVESSLQENLDKTTRQLFKTVKQFSKHELTRKRMVHDMSKQVQLLHNISEQFPLQLALLDQVAPYKDSLDVLLRSDAKILGLDLYAFARQPGFIRLEHKVDYLEVLSEEQSGSVNITISRASNANYVDFILQQILSTSPSRMKGELDVALVDEPGVGAGVVREFFQIIQHTFFNITPIHDTSITTVAPPAHVAEIGSQWLQMARDIPRNDASTTKSSKRGMTRVDRDVLRLFPLFQAATDGDNSLRITPRQLRVASTVAEEKQQAKALHLTHKELLTDRDEVKSLKQLYLCAGRLLGLAIRDQQPLDSNFPLAFWKFMGFERVSWEEYCGSNDVFKRSLQFVLDHDFTAEPLDMQFEYTTDVAIVAAGEDSGGASPTLAMEMELSNGKGGVAVTNENKVEYVELRAKHFFFGNEDEYYRKMRDGLGDAIGKFDLKLFLPSELQRVIRGDREIDIKGLQKSVIYSRGVTESNEVVRNFWEVVETFDQTLKEKLLSFWSGSALPPLFGFDANNRTNPHAAFWYFDLDPPNKGELCPTANTCDRRLMLPHYSTKESLREKLLVALEHGAVGYDRM